MVETSATSRSFPGWDAVPEDIIPDVDDTRDLGSEEKNWAALWVALAFVTSITIGGVIGLSNVDSWLFINASTEVNGSMNISEDLLIGGTLTAGNVDITNLTVENMNFTNLTITGDIFNISATETYVNDLFPNEYCTSDLGSIGLRWDNGYFCHNVSAEYFVGDGSFLTNLPAGTEYDPYWTGNQSSYFNTTDILGFSYYNSSDFDIADYFTSAEVLGFSYYNSTDFSIADYYLKNNPFSFWNDTYATFNKTYADTLYYGISNPFSYWNSTFATFNKTYADTLYYGLSNPFGFYNSTDFSISDYYLKNNPFGFYNSTDFDISDYSTTSTILGWSYYNATDFDITDYTTTSTMIGYGYYNSTDFDIADYLLDTSDTFTGNLTFADANNCIIFNSGGKICSGV